MNIFVLDKDPGRAAEYHCDKHVCKMILEAGQMLCAAHWVGWLHKLGKDRHDFELVRDMKAFLVDNVPVEAQAPWSLTHMNHPCSVWTRESLENYRWHLMLMNGLLGEYTKRYEGKIHRAEKVFTWLMQNVPPGMKELGQTPFEICMKEEYKISSDPVECYREYYHKDKVRFAKWKVGNVPAWWQPKSN